MTRIRSRVTSLVLSLVFLAVPLIAQEAVEEPVPLLPEAVVRALAGEISGTAAKRTVQDLTHFHRQRGSRGFQAASQRILERAREAGLANVEVISLPADGTVFYGTQRSRPAWDADFAELWEQTPGPGLPGKSSWTDSRRVASWEARPISLAEDSAGGEVAADLVDAGAGTDERDYQGKEVRGKLVLVSAQPGAAYGLAVDRHGAAGLISSAQNQRTAWWGEDETLVRWGHLETFPAPKTFSFMVSLQQARAWQERLTRGESVRLRASVKAGQHPGSYDVVTGTLPGRDPVLAREEIVFSCHLDHQRPGANDNASGCAAILEAGRTLAKLVRERKIPPLRRTLRFVFPPEIEGTIALLNARPGLAAHASAVIHMDMVGGDPEITRAVFHVTRSPKSLPTFVNDVGEAFGRFVNAESYAYAATGASAYPLADPEGGKRALQAEVVDYTEGSDHQVWTEGSFRVPAIYLNDWPDRYIHTHADTVANLDSTKLLRAAFLGAASAYYLADLDASGVPALWQVIRRHALERTATALARRDRLRAAGQPAEGENLLRFHFAYERAVVESITPFAPLPRALREEAASFLGRLEALAGGPAGALPPLPTPAGEESVVYRRAATPKGTMTGFGYDYMKDRSGRLGIPAPALLGQTGLWGGGAEYAYEALNLVDGRRTVRQVRDDLSAIYGPVPVAAVMEYLKALERIGVLLR
ncbi:MAG: aminopeptidase YwaD [Acidobacteriota bacterium]|nr:aminopeptidase YwaD [Acidobacteriota bacterium]